MKKIILTLSLYIFCTHMIAFSTHGYYQSDKEMATGYYVVIGAYAQSQESYAIRYAQKVSESGLSASYGFNSKKGLYFVFLDFLDDFDTAVDKMRQTRKNEQFGDAWVFVCKNDQNISGLQNAEGQVAEPGSKTDPTVSPDGKNEKKEPEAEQSEVEKVQPGQRLQETEEGSSAQMPQQNPVPGEGTTDENMPEEKIAEEEEGLKDLSGVKVIINLVNARNDKPVEGPVEIIDTERAKFMNSVNSGELVTLKDPDNGTGKISLVCNIFGFRKQQQEINYLDPLKDTSGFVDYSEGEYKINMELVRYHVGDIVVMYNVSFFKDAALMRPESKYEMNSLLEMLQENPNLCIRIHGHVNGKQSGKIISKDEAKEYFALSDKNQEGYGSAKELSKQRAELIKAFLMENGIQENRMVVKAWGGKRMIYDKLSTKADENVRVEIEILCE
ncbi:OmpA family protein [Fulvivirga sp. M361]|uniref:OmpA family protein n=1 Tax=Fulvivirga sp. M361 TaxID=2594266 RepID=UPI00117A7AA5|nr:OmpA family protein [Fulvivirga sp. M361]TRX56189.1 OmpA family protein [Fulvivirga sp. M361]